MPGGGWQQLLRFVQSRNLALPAIIVTPSGDDRTAEECLAAGAFDFVVNPVDRLTLVAVVREALRCNGQHWWEASQKAAPPHTGGLFSAIVGTSALVQEVLALATKVAASDTNLCIYGESGTGKELVARAIHSSRGMGNRPEV